MYDSFELERSPTSLIELFGEQLRWVRDNDKIYGKKPICSVVIESEKHLSLYVPTEKEYRIIENEIKNYLQNILPRHKNRISQLPDRERQMVRKYMNLPRKYYGYSSGNMVDTIHMNRLESIDMNITELFMENR